MNSPNGFKVNGIIYPDRMTNSTKMTFIRQNKLETQIKSFKHIPKIISVAIPYIEDEQSLPTNICTVDVVHEHSLDAAKQFAEIGITKFTQFNNKNPVILNTIGKDFMGDCTFDDVKDDLTYIRTLLCASTNFARPQLLPIKDKQCIYTQNVLVVRPSDITSVIPFLPSNELYKIGIISACPILQEKGCTKLNFCDFIGTLAIIKCIFQIAIAKKHKVLILTPFGDKDNIPISDVIAIYNYCILYYGHHFSNIVVAIPKYFAPQIYEFYLKGILKPQDVVKSIDAKYDDIKFKHEYQQEFKNSCYV